MIYRILLLVGVVAALVGLFFLYPDHLSPGSDVAWSVQAGAPAIIGGYGDNFCYDGAGVQTLSGSLSMMINTDGTGSIEATISTGDSGSPLHPTSSDALSGTMRIVSRVDSSSQVREDLAINGDIPGGDPSLPQTHALLAGKSGFDVYVDGKLRYKDLRGEWSLADAVRQGDGSIRQGGLLYSPLLRDKTGFSDPSRMEFTLLLHSDAPDLKNNPPYSVVLHLVFSDVTIERQPSTTGM